MSDDQDRILRALTSPDPETRRRGIFAAVKVTHLVAIPVLRDMAGSDELTELRFLARKALGFLCAQTPVPELSADSSIEEITAGLASEDAGLRARALQAAATKGDPSLLAPVEALLGETDAQVRSVLVLALSRLGGADQFENIVGMLSDPDARCRANSVEALHSLGLPRAFPHIVRMVQDSDNRVRTNALKALGELGKVNVLKCCEAMLDPSQEYWVRDSAVWLLTSWKSPDSVALLERALHDEYPAVAIKAKKGLEALAARGVPGAEAALARAGHIDDVESPEDFLEQENQPGRSPDRLSAKPVEERRRLSRAWLERELDDGSLPALLESLKSETDEEVLLDLIEALRRTGSVAAAPIVREYLGHESERVRELASRASRDLEGGEPLEALAGTEGGGKPPVVTLPEPPLLEPSLPEPVLPEPPLLEPSLPEPALPEPVLLEPPLPEPPVPERPALARDPVSELQAAPRSPAVEVVRGPIPEDRPPAGPPAREPVALPPPPRPIVETGPEAGDRELSEPRPQAAAPEGAAPRPRQRSSRRVPVLRSATPAPVASEGPGRRIGTGWLVGAGVLVVVGLVAYVGPFMTPKPGVPEGGRATPSAGGSSMATPSPVATATLARATPAPRVTVSARPAPRARPVELDCRGLDDGAVLSRPITFEIRSRGQPLSVLELAVDGVLTASWNSPVPSPASSPLDPARLRSGRHELKISGSTADGGVCSRILRFTVATPSLELQVLSPKPGSKVFGQVNVWVKPKVGNLKRMEVSVSGALVTSQKVGETVSPPWLVPWPTGRFADGPYTIEVAATTTDRVTGTVLIPVEVTKPAFVAEFKSPKSGDIVVEPVPMELSLTDDSGLGVDRTEFGAGTNLIEKKTVPPWTATLRPDQLPEGLVRLVAVAYRKDETRAEAQAVIMVRHLRPTLVPVVAIGPSGPLPAAAVLDQTPRVTLAGKPPRSGRFVGVGRAAPNVVVVFPASKFTDEQRNLEPVLSALSAFLGRVRQSGKIEVIGYSDRVLRSTESGRNPPRVAVGYPDSGRVLYDGIEAGLNDLPPENPRGVLVLLVDGPDTNASRSDRGSKIDGTEVLRRLVSKRIEVHVIGFGQELAAAGDLRSSLDRIARHSGGTSRILNSAAEVPAALEAIWAHVNAEVFLELVPALGQLKSLPQRLTIDLPGRSDVRLVHRGTVSVR